jgi:hypothetical protein
MAAEATVRKFKAFIKKYKRGNSGESHDLSNPDLNETPNLGPKTGSARKNMVIIEGT